jgi:hypothetical protein
VPLLFFPVVPTPTRKVKQRLRGESERDTDPVEIDSEEVVEDIRPEVGSEIVNVEDLAQGSGTSRF